MQTYIKAKHREPQNYSLWMLVNLISSQEELNSSQRFPTEDACIYIGPNLNWAGQAPYAPFVNLDCTCVYMYLPYTFCNTPSFKLIYLAEY